MEHRRVLRPELLLRSARPNFCPGLARQRRGAHRRPRPRQDRRSPQDLAVLPRSPARHVRGPREGREGRERDAASEPRSRNRGALSRPASAVRARRRPSRRPTAASTASTRPARPPAPPTSTCRASSRRSPAAICAARRSPSSTPTFWAPAARASVRWRCCAKAPACCIATTSSRSRSPACSASPWTPSMLRAGRCRCKSHDERPEKIACIGAGPASLACAAELRQRGFQVTRLRAAPAARWPEHLRRGRIQTAGCATACARSR